MMLFVAGFPTIVICFFGVFAYFLWKTFSHAPRSGVREIFEFYLSANEILRDDERKWYGFEVQEVISKGENILQIMHGAPPLVYFSLGALYNKVENHESAVKHLSYVVEEDLANKTQYSIMRHEVNGTSKHNKQAASQLGCNGKTNSPDYPRRI